MRASSEYAPEPKTAIADFVDWVDEGNSTSAFCLTFIPCLQTQQIAQGEPVELKELTTLLPPMLKTIEGIYQNGQIELTELPQDVSERTQVLITFLDPGKIDPTKLRHLIDQLETIAGIQQGFEELDRGQIRPIGNFLQEMQQKYDISG